MSLKKLDTPELNAFRGYLDALREFIVGANYVVWFGAKGFELPGATFTVEEMMRAAYPKSNPDKASLQTRSQGEMIDKVFSCLKLPDPPFPPALSPMRFK